MSDAFDVDEPELRMLAQLGGVAPRKIAAALNDPEHALDHLKADECFRLADGMKRLLAFELRMNAALDAALTRINE